MSSVLFTLPILFFICALSPIPEISATCTATVRVGSRGECVRELQRAIGVSADGIFGRGTNAAVKQFQARHGLTADGIVGPATWGVIHRGSAGNGESDSESAEGSSTGSLSNLDAIIAHMEITEGFRTTGYIPTDGSGVTVGFGIDLGQQSLSTLSGVPASIVANVKPYLGLKTRTEVANAGLSASDLQLTDQEAKDLSKPFIKKSADIAAEYGTKMSQKGRNVLASLRHWAGSLGCSSCHKLAPSGTNYVWNEIKNKDGTDAGLKRALELTLPGHTLGTAAYNRIKKEIDHLN